MANSVTSPNVDNYINGGGVLSFKIDGDDEYRDLGNARVVDMGQEVEYREHRSSRTSLRPIDRRDVQSRDFTIAVELEEWTPANMALFFGGSVSNDGTLWTIPIGELPSVNGALRWTSNNVGDEGTGSAPNFILDFPNVSIGGDGDLSLVSEDFSAIPLSISVQWDEATERFGEVNMTVGIPAVPTNVLLPTVIADAPQVGAQDAELAHPGLWTGTPLSYQYQWQENDGGWADIVGATAATYSPVVGNVGNTLRIGVKAVNPGGPAASWAYSAATPAVLAA